MNRATHGQATIAGHKGAKIINDTSPRNIEASIIELSADAVVTNLKVIGSDSDVKGDYISTPANPIGGNGGTIAAEDDKYFTSITLSAGTANWAK